MRWFILRSKSEPNEPLCHRDRCSGEGGGGECDCVSSLYVASHVCFTDLYIWLFHFCSCFCRFSLTLVSFTHISVSTWSHTQWLSGQLFFLTPVRSQVWPSCMYKPSPTKTAHLSGIIKRGDDASQKVHKFSYCQIEYFDMIKFKWKSLVQKH